MPAQVLVVDDDDDFRESFRVLLEQEGFQVHTAENGRAALDLLQTERPDLILLDLEMPVMNGWQFRERQKQIPTLAAIPLIVITASEPDGIDATVIFPKPFDVEQLLCSIRTTVNSA